ncbi:GNAT family N-acetyltransferase [Streptomyces sp. NPDC019224]|uniref:GNAT family N-acetyltransferase n=1 Tax=Streptomyces sp. NPDC019224 TaxID=3154484 RepID=UPI0033C24AAD
MTALATDTYALTLDEARGVTEVDGADWDALTTGASFYSSHAWLGFTERYGDCEPRHLVVRRAGRPVAALPTFRFTGDVPRYYDPAFLFPAAGYGDGPRRPLLLGGTRQGYTSEILLADGLPDEVAAAAVRLLLDRFRRLRDEETGLGALLYLTDRSVERLLPLLGPDDHVVLLDARARIPVEPTGMDGYRKLFSSHRFARMRKEMRQYEAAGCRTEVLRLSECHDQLGELSSQVLRRYGHQISAEDETDRFAAQAERLDDLCQVLVARQGDRIVGFTQFFVWDGVMYGRVHGVDDELGRAASLYYNLTYYRAIEHAAARGHRWLDLGCDSYETKARRGARLEPLWGLVLDARWDERARADIRAGERALHGELAGWDPRLDTDTARRLAARH